MVKWIIKKKNSILIVQNNKDIKSEKMKVLMIDALGSKGQASYDHNLCTHLSDLSSTEVLLQVPEVYNSESNKFIIKKCSAHTSHTITNGKRIIEYIKWLLDLCDTVLRWKPDIIHWQFGFFCLFDLFCNFFLRKRNPNVQFLITIHDVSPARPTINNTLARKAFFRSFNGFIAHSEEARLLFSNWIREDSRHYATVVIPHGPYQKPDFVARSRRGIKEHFGLSSEGPVIATVGSINENKDIKKALMILKEVQKLSPRANYVIAGSSGKRSMADLIKLANTLPYPDRIHIINRYLSDDEVDMLHYIADLTLLIYKEAATSGAAIRSLCAGVPVACNYRPGFTSIVRDEGNGLILNESKIKESADKIWKLLNNNVYFDEVKENALRSYQNITWQKIAEMHYCFYNKLIRDNDR